MESLNKYPDFRIENGSLYKYCRTIEGDGTHSWDWKLYVPRSERKTIMYDHHDHALAAHLGFFKTLKRVQERFYWPRMAADIREYVKVCEQCQINKPKCELSRVPMGEPKVPTRPWEIIAVDYMGPYPRSKSGNQYLLVVIDIFSKFVMLRPVRRAEGVSLTKYLEESIFLVFGVPSALISDNGSQFVSKHFKTFLRNYKVHHWLNANYHPQANPAERVNRSILAAIRSYINEDHRNWDENIAHIACAIRTAVHESSKYTPYCVNFGRNMITSGAREDIMDDNKSCKDEEDHQLKLAKVHKAVAENLGKAYEQYSKRYNLRTRPRQFEVGDIVLRKAYRQSKASEQYNAKLDSVYEKCIVKRKSGLNTYELEGMDGKKKGKYHANDLREYHELDRDSYEERDKQDVSM